MPCLFEASCDPRFWECYRSLEEIRRQADAASERLKADPQHPSLHFKRVGRFWSARMGLRYRALAVEGDDGLVSFWIGTHAEYDNIVR